MKEFRLDIVLKPKAKNEREIDDIFDDFVSCFISYFDVSFGGGYYLNYIKGCFTFNDKVYAMSVLVKILDDFKERVLKIYRLDLSYTIKEILL